MSPARLAYDPAVSPVSEKVPAIPVALAPDPLSCAEGADAVVLMTEWPEIVKADWSEISKRMDSSRFLFDGRNALDPVEMEHLGFKYRRVGRGPSRQPRPSTQ